MKNNELVQRFLEVAIQKEAYGSIGNLRFYLNRLFKDITLDQKAVLDIGCGIGLASLYAACMGANPVIGIEPEAAGSSTGTMSKFLEMIDVLGLKEITVWPYTIQEYDPGGQVFDVVVMVNSINHLDEEACINLQFSKSAQDKYSVIFEKLNKLLKSNGKLIITDCSRYNFFAALGLRNPFAPDIEWHKHQSPRFWADLLENCGFTNPKISWNTFNTLREFGKPFNNCFASFFLTSHFRLVMDKK